MKLTKLLRLIMRHTRIIKHYALTSARNAAHKALKTILGMKQWPEGSTEISPAFTVESLSQHQVNDELPFISIIMPVYNACRNGNEHFLKALESIANQTYRNFELIVVDDGSSDNSLQVFNDFISNRKDINAKYFLKENSGQSFARNFGVSGCQGEYVSFIDQDDEWYTNKLELIVPWLSDKAIDVFYTSADTINDKGEILYENIHKSLLAGWPHPKRSIEDILFKDIFILPGMMTIKKDSFKHVGGFDENLSGYEDDDLFLRLFESSRISYLPFSSIRWRMHKNNYSLSYRMIKSRSYYCHKLLMHYTDDGRNKLRVKFISLRFFWEFLIQAINQYDNGNDLYMKNIDGARRIISHLPTLQKIIFASVFLLPTKYLMYFTSAAKKFYHAL